MRAREHESKLSSLVNGNILSTFPRYEHERIHSNCAMSELCDDTARMLAIAEDTNAIAMDMSIDEHIQSAIFLMRSGHDTTSMSKYFNAHALLYSIRACNTFTCSLAMLFIP